jgi:hypothetical protein
MAPILSRLSSLGGGGTAGPTFGKRRTFSSAAPPPPPILAYSLTTQQNFNSSNSYDFDLTSNPNDLSKAVTVMMWVNVSSSQSEGFGNQSGTIWNWNPGGLSYSGPGMSFSKPSHGYSYGFSGAPNDNGLSLGVQGNTWVHMVWQRNASNQIRAWFNGNALCNYTTQSDISISSLNYAHRLGYSIGGYTYSMNGSVTDVFIYKNECYYSNTISIPTRGGGVPF